jgi:hypothetical protein
MKIGYKIGLLIYAVLIFKLVVLIGGEYKQIQQEKEKQQIKKDVEEMLTFVTI